MQRFRCGISINHNRREVNIDYPILFDSLFYGFTYHKIARLIWPWLKEGLRSRVLTSIPTHVITKKVGDTLTNLYYVYVLYHTEQDTMNLIVRAPGCREAKMKVVLEYITTREEDHKWTNRYLGIRNDKVYILNAVAPTDVGMIRSGSLCTNAAIREQGGIYTVPCIWNYRGDYKLNINYRRKHV